MGESVAQDQLRAFVERVERMDEELKAINDDKKEIYAEAKANGFDVKALKAVIAARRKDEADRLEFEALIDLYRGALGMASGYDSSGPSYAHVHEDTNMGMSS